MTILDRQRVFLNCVPPDCLSVLVLTYWYILAAVRVTEGQNTYMACPLTVSWGGGTCPLFHPGSDAYVDLLKHLYLLYILRQSTKQLYSLSSSPL